jgi:hypothetical protein
MNRRRPLILVASVAAAVVAGLWAGDVAGPPARPGVDASALARLNSSRVHARARLNAAGTAHDQSAAAQQLAAVYRRAAHTLPGQEAALDDAATAYDALSEASSPMSYAAGSQRVVQADAALAASLRHPAGEPGDPLIPPVLPLVMLAAAAAGGAVSSRRRRPVRRPEPPPAPPEPAPSKSAWDTPPPFGI